MSPNSATLALAANNINLTNSENGIGSVLNQGTLPSFSEGNGKMNFQDASFYASLINSKCLEVKVY